MPVPFSKALEEVFMPKAACSTLCEVSSGA
jgi:hypothetical protein